MPAKAWTDINNLHQHNKQIGKERETLPHHTHTQSIDIFAISGLTHLLPHCNAHTHAHTLLLWINACDWSLLYWSEDLKVKYNPQHWQTRETRSYDAIMDLHLLSCLTTIWSTAKEEETRVNKRDKTDKIKWEKKKVTMQDEKSDERTGWGEMGFDMPRCAWEIKSFNVWTLCGCQRRKVKKMCRS